MSGKCRKSVTYYLNGPLKNIRIYLGAGDGLFARVDIPANTACAFYNGIRVKPGIKFFWTQSMSK